MTGEAGAPGVAHVSARLEDELVETTARLDALRRDFDGVVAASVDSNADDEHDPEGATIAYERSQLAALIEQAERHLADVDAAVARLHAGRYGVCQRCGRPIPPERLEARPTARMRRLRLTWASSRSARASQDPRARPPLSLPRRLEPRCGPGSG